ncbi:hypothetical protein HYD66_00960 [Mycoplasmopsis bovis]|nr:hypothetical protein [Mycoplasmopsis bovis]QQH55025.1 hypothetical protein HYD66_00960 [Mycoplasmopsis bovis]
MISSHDIWDDFLNKWRYDRLDDLWKLIRYWLKNKGLGANINTIKASYDERDADIEWIRFENVKIIWN